MKNKHIHSFVSYICLSFLFEETTFLSIDIHLKMVHHDINEYLTWAEKRIELLVYELTEDTTMSLAEKVRIVDQKILSIFPFLMRIVDRSYIIEKFLMLLQTKKPAKTDKISLQQSVHALRRIAHSLGIPNAYLLTKKQITSKLLEQHSNLILI